MRAYRGQAPVRPETRQTGVTAFVRVTPVGFLVTVSFGRCR